ncbi:MAG: ATP phosphoribosyltransferase [Oligoflexales bacterium]
MSESRIRIAVQKSGRLSKPTLELLNRCGLKADTYRRALLCPCEDFPVDLLFVRDDDIPMYVNDGACDIGIVGLNEAIEKAPREENRVKILEHLGFGQCRLAIAIPEKDNSRDFSFTSLNGLKIASSYPVVLKQFLEKNSIIAEVIEMQGSVEIAPYMGIADAICDLVSSGQTLKANKLHEVGTVLKSQAVVIGRSGEDDRDKINIITKLLNRMLGVKNASTAKYIMMNAPKSSLSKISELIPGMEMPTVIPLCGSKDQVAVHAVAQEPIFWETIERLKEMGASSIIVSPIEKIID